MTGFIHYVASLSLWCIIVCGASLPALAQLPVPVDSLGTMLQEAPVDSFLFVENVEQESGPLPDQQLSIEGAVGASLDGMGMAAQVTYARGPHLVTLRTAGEYYFLAPLVLTFLGSEDVPVALSDYALLYGRRVLGDERAFISIGSGVSLVGVSWLEKSEENQDRMVFGLPAEVRAAYRVAPWFGLEAYGFGNLNKKKNFLGIGLGFRYGKLD